MSWTSENKSNRKNTFSSMTLSTAASTIQPKVSKWRIHKQRQQERKRAQPKLKLTKEERRAKYTEIARQKQESQKFKNVVCFQCRKTGHAAEHCPQNEKNDCTAGSTSRMGICFLCGSIEHVLAQCPTAKRNGATADAYLPFATCFVCKENGHLASQCPKNEHGIYVNGGACNICGSNQHWKTNCPQNTTKKREKEKIPKENNIEITDLLESSDLTTKESDTVATEQKHATSKKKRRIVKF
jgi:zinc finger CCHC domain-containing protein 9